MSDEFRIPPPGYRSGPERRAAEGRRLVLTGGAVGVVLLLIVIVYAAFSGGPATVPIITAPTTPVKIKPSDPGGLDLPSQSSQLLGGAGSGGTANLAPAPEVPNPAGLAASQNQPPAPAPAPAAPASPPAVVVPSVPETAAKPGGGPTTHIVPPSRSAARVGNLAQEYAPATHAMKSGHVQVQLAALESVDAAHAEWDHLAHRMPDLFQGRSPIFMHAEVNGRSFWRVRTSGFGSVAAATKFCDDVRAQGGRCTVAAF